MLLQLCLKGHNPHQDTHYTSDIPKLKGRKNPYHWHQQKVGHPHHSLCSIIGSPCNLHFPLNHLSGSLMLRTHLPPQPSQITWERTSHPYQITFLKSFKVAPGRFLTKNPYSYGKKQKFCYPLNGKTTKWAKNANIWPKITKTAYFGPNLAVFGAGCINMYE